jgi:hypothetical protein
MTDGREEGDMGGRGYIKGRRGGGRSCATLKRTGSQAKVDMWLGRRGRTMGGERDVFCADSVTAVEGDRSCQCRVGRTERTAEREDERGHDMRGRGGGQEDMLNNSIIVNVGDLVHGVIIARRCLSRGGQGRQGGGRSGGRNGIRIEPRSGSNRSLILSSTSSPMSFDDSLPRLLLPAVRTPRTLPPPPPPPSRSPKIKSSSSRSSRTRLVSPPPQPPPDPREPYLTTGQVWLGKNANFEIVQDQLQLEGFQLFAVEKWFVLQSTSLPCSLRAQHMPGSQRGQGPS